MKENELKSELLLGEDSGRQFKKDFRNVDSLAAELVAFANSGGGKLFIGVADDGSIAGLSHADIARINQLLSNAASNNVRPPIHPITQNLSTTDGVVLVAEIHKGLNKPYMDSHGRIWVKCGADKRQVSSREEMQRMFQDSGLLHADELPVANSKIADLDIDQFSDYFARRYSKPVTATGLPTAQLLQNLNLVQGKTPNLCGLLLFGKNPAAKLPAFLVKAVCFAGTDLHEPSYLDSEEIDGRLELQYERALAFLKRNLHHLQSGKSFNSPPKLEIPHEVLEEILVNALVHRDYFVTAPVRLLIFRDRIEICSPGHLPNNLDTDKIRFGISNLRNPVLASHAFHILPYRGLGSGILRAISFCPGIQFFDDRDGNQFKVTIPRVPSADRSKIPTFGGVKTQNGRVNGGVKRQNGRVKHSAGGEIQSPEHLLGLIRANPGMNGKALSFHSGKSRRTIDRWLQELKLSGQVEFRGAPKTGGYWPKKN